MEIISNISKCRPMPNCQIVYCKITKLLLQNVNEMEIASVVVNLLRVVNVMKVTCALQCVQSVTEK
jgi:hypothetical protein